MNKRLEMLEKMVSAGGADSFARYALAMEYRKAGRAEDALACFDELRRTDAEYLAQYLMAGQMLLELGRAAEARVWLEQGVTVAQRQGNAKALGELQAALGEADGP
jgi:tetratricopeptide (TPR) repeat protein